MAKPRITQTTPYDSPGTLVSGAKDLNEFQPGHPQGGCQIRGGLC